jgi:hypothetical protein
MHTEISSLNRGRANNKIICEPIRFTQRLMFLQTSTGKIQPVYRDRIEINLRSNFDSGGRLQKQTLTSKASPLNQEPAPNLLLPKQCVKVLAPHRHI